MSIDGNACETETIKAFVNPRKRDRYIAFIADEKRRKEFVRNLCHFDDFDARYIVPITPSAQYPAGVEALLVKKGAGSSCHVISEWKSLDGRQMNLAEALKETIGSGMGTILCCKCGQLAFFENEDQRFILEHQTNKGKA